MKKNYFTISMKMATVLRYGSLRLATSEELGDYERERERFENPVWVFEPFDKNYFDSITQCSSLATFLDTVLVNITN